MIDFKDIDYRKIDIERTNELLFDSELVGEDKEVFKPNYDIRQRSLKRAQTLQVNTTLIDETTSSANSELHWLKNIVWKIVEAAMTKKDASNEQLATFIKFPIVTQLKKKSPLSSLLVLNTIIT